MKTYLYNFDSEENSYLVSDYPWGFRLRTEQRYWIETKDKSNGGQRFCIQTKNPKTGFWCNAKKGTYSDIVFMYLDENSHVQVEKIHSYNSDDYDLKELYEKHKEHLSEYQIRKIKWFMGAKEVRKHITVTIEAKPQRSEEEEAKHQAEQFKIKQQICRAVENRASKIEL